jgi:hypothetical protein
MEQFFLALAIGVIALKRAEETGAFSLPVHEPMSTRSMARRFRP